MKNKYIKTGMAFLMYALSVLSLLVLDLYISKNYSEYFVAEWAFLKGFILIVVSTVSLGYESIIIRDPGNIRVYLKRYIIPCIIYSLLLALIFNILKGGRGSLAIATFSIVMGLNVLFSSFYKTKNNVFLSQFLMNGWKFVFPVIFLCFNNVDLPFAILISAFICLLLSSPMIFRLPINNESKSKDIFRRKTLIYLFINSITLAIATNGEQIILNTFAETSIAYDIFIYILVFCSIISGLSGFIGFYLVYFFKKTPFNYLIYKKYSYVFVMFLVLIFLLNLGAGCILMEILYNEFNLKLAVLFSILGTVRFAYVFSSVMMSLYSSEINIAKISKINLFLVMTYTFIFILICMFDAAGLIYLIALIMIIHWLLRVLIMNRYTMRSFTN